MKRQSKTDRSPTTAVGIMESEREAARKKTIRLRAERLAREAAEADSAAQKPTPRTGRKGGSASST